MNKIFNVLIIIFCACLFSCDTLWNGDLKERLSLETQTKIHFYSNKEEDLQSGEKLYMTERSYRIGNTISAKDMPGYDDSEIVKWTSGYRLGGWKYYRWTSSKEEIADSSLITSMTVTADEVDLYAVWFAKYVVVYNYMTTDAAIYDDKSEVRYGEPGTMTDVNPPVIPGFENPVFSNATIANDGTTEITVTYDRKHITVLLDTSGGTVSDGANTGSNINVSGLYGSAFDKDIITVTPPSGLIFVGWSPALPDTFPAEDTTYTAVYKGQEFAVDYYDYNFGGTGKTFSGSMTSLPRVYETGTKLYIPSPVSGVSSAENTVEFAGWYTDEAGTVPLASDGRGYYIDVTTMGDVSLYAKWKAKYIYVDPANGNDDNDSFTSSTALKTIAKAKTYLQEASLDSPAIRVLSTISDSTDLTDLDNLSTASYNDAILQKASQLAGALLEINSGISCTLSNITIDGGSSSSSAPAIVVDGGDLTLGPGAVIQNFNISNSSVKGLIDLSYGGSLSLNGADIKGNSIASGYSVYHSDSTSILNMSGATQIDVSTPVYLDSGCKITVTGELTNDSVAKVYSTAYTSSPQVLDDNTGGTLLKTNYNKFISAHDDYTIANDGRLYPAAGLEIDFSNPDIKVYELGSLVNYTGSVNLSGSDTSVEFAVNDGIYDYITEPDVTGQKVIYVSIKDDSGNLKFINKVNIDGSSKKASVDLIHSASGSSDITNSGIYHGIIYTNATSSHGDIYFERVYFDILVLP
ncbi:MAG: InlB B-repeat-containing protein [Spirochaetia bacterium]|nr:InlB B-repeat-containing protein [Spirochaetia bacterium]